MMRPFFVDWVLWPERMFHILEREGEGGEAEEGEREKKKANVCMWGKG